MKMKEKLSALRAAMQAQGLDAYIIPSSDSHQSEYVADYWKSRQWISGFTGSAATVVVAASHAGLWTDSRYFIQAEEQLKGSGVELHKLNIPHTPEHQDWIKENLAPGSKVGLDGRLFSVGQVRKLAKAFHEKNIALETSADLITGIWKDRSTLPQDPIFDFDVKFAGTSREQKFQSIREKMNAADYYLISTLDDVAWLFNLRGNDVECNPLFYAFAVVGKEAAYLFIEENKVDSALKSRLNNDGILLKPYGNLEDFLRRLPDGKTILVDLASTSNQVYNAIPREKIKEGENIVASLKTIKNPTEIQQLKKAMAKDGAALVRLFRWLEKEIASRPVPETEVAEKLIELRKEQGDYFGESFDAIVGYEANGAIVHYRPEAKTCAQIKPHGILLLDSGGQYLDGTTDITRTAALSNPTEEQKRDFTLVLKGHIALAAAIFPKGTTGVQLDAFARHAMWQHRLNFGHGTGHGVGFFLCVHEGPQGFSPVANSPRASTAFEPGMLTSNEPGLYRAGKYGIRTENLVLCVENGESEFGKFYKFETLTLFPIDLNLVEKSILNEGEKDWLDNYHKEVYEKISPLLNEEEKKWLHEKCSEV